MNQPQTPLSLRIRQRFFRARALGTGLLALVACLSLWTLMQFVEHQRREVSLTDLAGRQRMLSQRISKLGLWLSLHPDDTHARSVLQGNINRWRRVQAGMLLGDRELNLPPAADARLTRTLQKGMAEMAAMEKVVERICSSYLTADERQKASFELLALDDRCLTQCESVVEQVVLRQKEDFSTLALLQYGAMAALLLLVIGVSVFLTRPQMMYAVGVIERLALKNRRFRKVLKKLERKQYDTDEALNRVSASESRYRLLVENSSDFIYEVTYNGFFIYASQSLISRLGLLKAELTNLTYMVLVRPDFRQRLADYYSYTIKERQVATYYEFPVIGRNGEEIWLGQTGTTLFDEDGRVVSIQFIARDLTQFHRLSSEKESQQRMLSAILQSSKDSICTFKPIYDNADEIMGMECVLANPSASRMFGVEDLVGKTMLEVLPLREAVALRTWCADGLTSRHAREREGMFTLNGEPRWLRISSTAIQDGLVLTITDTTSEKQAGQELQEQKNFYETILNHLPSEVAVYSPEERYMFLNPTAVRNSEMRTWLIGKTDYEYAEHKGRSTEKADLRHSLFKQARQTRKPVWFEDVFETPDGPKAFLRNFYPIYNDKNELSVFIGNGIDITDRKNMEAEIEQARRTAEASAQARQSFINNMSHEMRTPLNAVIGLTHVLLEEAPRPDQTENLRAMQFSANNLLALINDVLDFGKLDAGKVELEEIPFRLPELMDGIYTTFRHQAIQRGIDFRLALPEGLPNYLVGDPVRLTQIFNNLVSNAIRFTQIGGVLVQVDDLGWHEGKLSLGFRVQDTGIGIAPDKLLSVFETFTQAEGDTTRRFGGTGLGLSITKRLLEIFGSEIRLESELGKGSTFSFSLRFSVAKPATMSQPVSQSLLEESPLAGMKVLLVEDNEINRLVACKFLKRWGVVPSIAVNGQDALDAVQRRRFDLVMMDIQMPVMDGFTASRAIREISGMGWDELPIIALTATTNQEVEEQSLQAGMNAVMSKPLNPSELHEALTRFYRPQPLS